MPTKGISWFPWMGLLVLAVTSQVWGFEFERNANGQPITWNPGSISMQIKLGVSPVLNDGTNYSTSVQTAMQAWNANIAAVQFVPQIAAAGGASDKDGVNEIAFGSTVYGKAFDANVLAVTTYYYSGTPRSDGTSRTTQADIIFNSAFTWDSYRGTLQGHVPEDIRRVALHELGHVLGLTHPDQATPPQTVAAVMNSSESDVDSLQADDVVGAQNLYGAPVVINPAVNQLGDFDGDGKSDILWTNTTTGERSIWFQNGNTTSGGASLGVVPVAWIVSAKGDFDGDGKADIFWTNTQTGDRAIWLMNGSTMRTNVFMGTIPVAWVVSGTGDFNGDGKADLVWTNTTTGDRAMWLLNGTTVTGGGFMGTVPVAWVISGTGDFNGDGKTDLVWSNTVTGERSMWFMNGSTTTSGATLNTVPVAWVINAVGDFNGDGKADIVLTNTVTGDRVIWLMNGSTIVTNAFMGTVPVAWAISGSGDYNGDGKKDLVWTNTATGDRAMWLLNGTNVAGGGYIGTVPVAWKINN